MGGASEYVSSTLVCKGVVRLELEHPLKVSWALPLCYCFRLLVDGGGGRMPGFVSLVQCYCKWCFDGVESDYD